MQNINEFLNDRINEGWWPFGKKKDEEVKPNKQKLYQEFEKEIMSVVSKYNKTAEDRCALGDFVPLEDFFGKDGKCVSDYKKSMALQVTNGKGLYAFFVMNRDSWEKYSKNCKATEKLLAKDFKADEWRNATAFSNNKK